jgi:hypothetical protein
MRIRRMDCYRIETSNCSLSKSAVPFDRKPRFRQVQQLAISISRPRENLFSFLPQIKDSDTVDWRRVNSKTFITRNNRSWPNPAQLRGLECLAHCLDIVT